MRHILGGILEQPAAVTIVDMEAGLEHHQQRVHVAPGPPAQVLEPYYKALETARRTAELGRELGISTIQGVANKLRDDEDARAVREFAAAHGITLTGEIPFDDELRRADLAGRAPIEATGSPVVAALDRLRVSLQL